MKNFIVDIGNTRIKTALFDGGALVEERPFEDIETMVEYSKTLEFESSIVSSVTLSEAQLSERISFPFLFLDRDTKIPFSNKYASPDTLGVDRKAAAIGARAKFPGQPVLAIDMGSCITYDLMDQADQYLGGGISPGLQMRFKAMNQLTARLSLANLPEGQVPELIGDTTVSCMQSGVYYGIQFEMMGMVAAYMAKYPDLKVIICGGDSKIFESLTKDHIFVIPNLVLFGLNRILSYNVHYH